MNAEVAFIRQWHTAARLAVPRIIPDAWLRQAAKLIGQGITHDDLALVAKWMLTQLSRSQSNERNAVAFNAASFRWTLMFGEWGASNEGVRFAELLSLAESVAQKQRAPQTAKPSVPMPAMSAEDEEVAREERRRSMADFRRKMAGGQQP